MKKHMSFLTGLLVCFFVFMFTGCPSQVNSDTPPAEKVTITFDNNGTVFRTVEIEKNGIIPEDKIPSDPSHYANYFMYWSKSKASQAEAVPFNFDTQITEDTTLYAIYTPKLTNSISVSSTQIEIALFYTATSVFPLDDGSYAGIAIEYSSNGTTYEKLPLSIPSNVRDSAFRYLTYDFSNPLEEGMHYFKVSNGRDTYEKTFEYVRPENIKTVTFDDNGTIQTIEVTKGKVIPSDKRPKNPSKSYNNFMYWSKSKASKAKAETEKFDFDTPITDDLILYAIYTPSLDSSGISSLTSTQIEIVLYDTNVFPLEDGSYAGIDFEHSTDGTNYEILPLNIPSETRDLYSTRYLTYDFDAPLVVGTHYFRVTNVYKTFEKEITVTAPSAVTNLSASVNDSYAKISFNTVPGWSHTVKVLKQDVEVASKNITSYSYSSEKNVEFFGLENDVEYTIKVLTDGSDKFAETTATPEIAKKTSDWVVAMYMDGDNDLHNQIYLDMNEVEYGLYQIRKSNGEAANNYDSVNVVALWDGAISWIEKDDAGIDVTVTPKVSIPGTYLFELGADSGNSTYSTSSSGYVLSDNTKNLSYTADWIVGSEKTVSTSHPTSCGEVNMGDEETLEHFLKWVNAHYTAKKGIILQFSDHGGGPRAVRYVKTADGRIVKVGDENDRRALCWDYSSGKNYLKTKDVSDAFKAAGFGTSNKASIILMDLCLGSSVEDAYQFKDYAEYYAASPNTIPGIGLNYVYFMKSFTKNIETEVLAKQILLDYRQQYAIDNDMWDYFAQQYYGDKNATYSKLSNSEKAFIEWVSDFGITTFTITDLSKIDDVKDSINALCDVLISNEGKSKTVYVDANGSFSPTVTSKTENYVSYLGQHHANVVNYGKSGYYIDETMYYMGSFTWLYDIAYMAINMEKVSRANLSGVANENAWEELNAAAINVILALDTAIKYSWRDSKLNSTHKNDFYYTFDNNTYYEHFFGLTICGANIATNGDKLVDGTAPDFYKTDLEFGKDSKWGDLLEYWFGK